MQIDILFQRGVFAVAQLDDAGDLHEVDTGAVVEGASDSRTRNDKHLKSAEILDQRMRDRPAALQVAEPERVVAVHENSSILYVLGHC
jgi:hypothetical protein